SVIAGALATKQSSSSLWRWIASQELAITGLRAPGWLKSRAASQRRLLVPAFLADEFHPGHALGRRDAIRRAALSADRVDAGIALLDDNGLLRHRLADQALRLLAHRSLVYHGVSQECN